MQRMKSQEDSSIFNLFKEEQEVSSSDEDSIFQSKLYEDVMIEYWTPLTPIGDFDGIEEVQIDGNGLVKFSVDGTELMVCTSTDRPENMSPSESCTHGIVWPAARALCQFLSHGTYTAVFDSNRQINTVDDFQQKVVVELGAGTGAMSLWVARRWPNSNVIITDQEVALPLIEANIALNNLDNAHCEVLAFGEDMAGLKALQGRDVDIVLCTDVIFTVLAKPYYWTELAETLAQALSRDPPPIVWFQFQERYGTRDISPFFHALREASSKPLLIKEICFGDSKIKISENNENSKNYQYEMRLFWMSS